MSRVAKEHNRSLMLGNEVLARGLVKGGDYGK